MKTKNRGQLAEQLACRFLQMQGLIHISQNFNRRIGEIDLIMFDKAASSWVLVEVRYRKSHAYGNATDSVDLRKQTKLRRVARAFLQTQPQHLQRCRIDVIGLSPLTSLISSQNEITQNLYGRVSTEFDNHYIDWIINAVEE
jgi:putative endonuclease